MTGAFQAYAARYAKAGLAIMPVRGKSPLIGGFSKPRGRYGAATVARWADLHPDASIGLLTRRSGLAIVDIDDADMSLLARVCEALGPTPCVVATRRGWHLYYRARLHRTFDLRPALDVDVKAGAEAWVLAPGSTHKGHEYGLEGGGNVDAFLEALEDIPEPTAEQWDALRALAGPRPVVRRDTASNIIRIGGGVQEGGRNVTLFTAMMREARAVSRDAGIGDYGLEELTRRAHGFNAEHNAKPLSDAETAKTARSAWSYEARGENRAGSAKGEATKAIIDPHEPEALGWDANAIKLLVWLRQNMSGEFPLNARGMADNDIVPGMHRKAIIGATKSLLTAGLIERVLDARRPRGTRTAPGSAALYRLTGAAQSDMKPNEVQSC